MKDSRDEWTTARLAHQVESLRGLLSELGPENRGLAGRLSRRAQEAIEGLSSALEELSVADAELRERNALLEEAHEAIEQERRRYQDLFDSAPDAYLVTDPQGRVFEANRAAAEMLAVAQRFLVGKVLALYFPTEDHRAFRAQLARLGQQREIRGWEARLQARGGRIFDASINATAIYTAAGRYVAARWLLRDITRRKEAELSLARHIDRLQLTQAVDRAILEARSPAEIAAVAAPRLRRLVNCDRVAVAVFDHERGLAERLAVDSLLPTSLGAGQKFQLFDYGVPEQHSRGEPAHAVDLVALENPSRLLEALAADGLRSCLSLPLIARGRLIGNLNLANRKPGAFPDEIVAVARQVADSLAVALDNAHLLEEASAGRKQLQNLARRLVEVQESERREIAHDLHDDAGQMMAALILGLGALDQCGDCPPALHEQVHELKEMADRISTGLHTLAIALRPASLDKLGLVPAVRQYVETFIEQTGLDVTLVAPGLDAAGDGKGPRRLPLEVETVLYRIIQEALANVARHAQARHVSVILERRPGKVLAIVEDDGDGFDYDEALSRGRLGLVGMRERAEVIGGRLTIETSPGNGTTVFVEVPNDGADPHRG